MNRKALILFCFCALPVMAADVDPSKTTVPEKFNNGGGGRFSIFASDPKRIQRANAINFADMETKVEVSPNPLSLKEAADAPSGRPSIKVSFSVRNKGKKTYTLSFPNAQRYDITVKNSTGQILYTWSADKEFVDQVGTILINAGDIIGYNETVALGEFNTPPAPGAYVVEITMSNYPELSARAPFAIHP